MQHTIFVGIDLSQETMTVAWYQAPHACQTAVFPRTEDGCTALHQWCARRGVAYHWVMEATGSLWQRVAQYAAAHGIPVSVLNPQSVHALGGVEGRVAKTDALDAELIAACAQVLQQRGMLRVWEPSEAALQTLRQLLRLRAQYQEQLVAQRASLRALQEQGASEAVMALAAQAVAAAQALVEAVEAQVQQWEREHTEWQPVLRRLRTAPGIGRWSALTLIAEAGSLLWLRDGKAFVRYCGLAPVVKQSGRRSGLGYGVCRAGNRWLRRALYLAALSAVRVSARYRAVYQGLVARGKGRKVALVAVARRLAELVYALQREGRDYDPSWLDKDLTLQDRISLRSE
ncbi:MAG: IS110 family transposase [Fimbriimonadales bacterium]|nr:IS110 family transposase [Fimbriimonadales bacterium]